MNRINNGALKSDLHCDGANHHPVNCQLRGREVNRSLDWGRHQAASREAQLRVIGLNHPPHLPIHNEVPPFMTKRHNQIKI